MSDVIENWWKEIISLAILLPLFWFLLRSFITTNEKWFQLLATTITEHDINSKELFKTILASIGKTSLSDWKTIEIARRYVLAASFEKLDYIKQRLEKNNLKERKPQIERQIKAQLIRISKASYITPLNSFTTPAGPLWDWIWKNFLFDDFIKEVFDVVFRNEDKWDISKKLNDITTLMTSYQNELWDKLEIEYSYK